MLVRDTLLIDGEWRKPSSSTRIDVISPSTEAVIGSAPDANADDVHTAAQAARNSFDTGTWRALPAAERAAVLERAFSLLEPRLAEVASLVTGQMGLPTAYATMLMPAALSTGRYFVKIAQSTATSEVRQTHYGPAAVIREPVGVVASIAPWNGPFNMALAKIVPALITGCSVVYKPAPETPLDAFVIAEALAEAGVPAGVFNLITGGRDAGRALVAHPDVDKVSFTGSTTAGREIGRECGASFKRVQLELGGKSAAIVLPDADIATTMQGLAMGSFFNSGQVCASYSRVLIHRSRATEMTEALVATAQSLVVGDPFDPATTMGPLVSRRQQERVLEYIEVGRSEGAIVATGGGRPAAHERGWYVEPTVFTGTDNSMRISREEIFGPVVAVQTFDTIDEAIAIANDSDYGLHGAVFTADIEAAARVARAVRTGTFSVNSFIYNTEAPFGGVKCSGIGRDTGAEAVQAYYELKTVNLTPSMTGLFA